MSTRGIGVQYPPRMSEGKRVALCGVAEVAPGCVVRAEHGGCAYAVFNVEGRIYVTQDECTHGPGLLSEGYVLDDEVECPFHQGRFHIPSGTATCAPATDPLKTWTARIVDDKVCIDPDEHATRGKSVEDGGSSEDDVTGGCPSTPDTRHSVRTK